MLMITLITLSNEEEEEDWVVVDGGEVAGKEVDCKEVAVDEIDDELKMKLLLMVSSTEKVEVDDVGLVYE